MTSAPAALRALLANAIDYAGLFPPASLPLEKALRNQASYVDSAEAWMLGAFVLPVEQFDTAAPFVGQFDPAHPLRVSALGRKTDDAEAFRRQLGEIVAAIQKFETTHGARVRIEQVEMPLPPDADAALLRDAGAALAFSRARMFWETPVAGSAAAMDVIASQRVRQPGSDAGFKLRTGGTAAAAFPSTAQVAEILVTGARHPVPMKFTAGLHHPIRHFNAAIGTKMHGFLNVLGAGVFAREHGWDVAQTASLLADEDPAALHFFDPGLTWRHWRIATDRILVHRQFITSFGSCSFDEPREDLRALHLL